VLHVIESLERGGAERVLATLARALRHQVEVHVVSLVGRGPLSADLRLAGAQVYSLDLRHRRDFWRALPVLGRLVHRLGPDVVHAHLRFSELYAAAVPRPARTRLVATFHNQGFDAMPMGAADHLVRGLERHVLKSRFDRFFAVSKQSAESYQRHLSLPEVSVIYNPVDVERVRRFAAHRACHATAQRLREGGRKLVVQVGSFRPLKGHDVTLEALKQREAGDRFSWVCVGDGPSRMEVEHQVQALQLSSWTHFAGESSYDDTVGWLAEADVVVQPSRSEGVPLVLLEAMALGRPVVATRVGGIPEVMEEARTGRLIEPGNAMALSRAIDAVFAERDRTEAMVTRARAEVQAHFDAPLIAEQWRAAYASLA
jgi:glycosyltransferase involved in cell wall biosynthesis